MSSRRFSVPSASPLCPTGSAEQQDDDYDWTKLLTKGGKMTDHIRFFREKDWSRTVLGPLKDWNPTLQYFTRMVLADRRPACVFWGPLRVAIYNELFTPLAGRAHPKLMGGILSDTYAHPEIEEKIKPHLDRIRKSSSDEDYVITVPLMSERLGWPEETYFEWTSVPIPGNRPGDSPPDGIYTSMYEITHQVLYKRRTQMLNRMASVPSLTLDSACPHILANLIANAADVPFAILYEARVEPQPTTFWLRGSVGLPHEHPLLVNGDNINSSKGMIPDMRRAGSEILTIDIDKRFDGITWRGFGLPPKQIAILPVTYGSRIFGYLIKGTNPCRPKGDESCKQFQIDTQRMVSSIVTGAVITDESRMREHQLETDLAISDLKLRHLIEHAQVGMVHMAIDGDLIWANDIYFQMHGLPQHKHAGRLDLFDMYSDEDRDIAEQAWTDLLHGADRISIELRLKRLYKTPLGESEPAQVQVLAFPYREDGVMKGIMAATTDISHLAWAKDFQARLAAEAREAKRQQEAFIDVVSHEMRNPLSAIVHCADEISKNLEETQTYVDELPERFRLALHENAASVNIIVQCANHQKRIIDDVLTLSKLNSMILTVTPSPVEPPKLIDSILGIFDAEFKSKHIRYEIMQDGSLEKLNIRELYMDPSRVTQIFINLITNAVKFMRASPEADITIHYGATLSNPRAFFPEDIVWSTKTKENPDITENPEWGTGEVVYLTFIVQDSGIGMDAATLKNLFGRFQQGNVRTHVRYGGSGLGLYISKELTEKQGGEIGVSSELGVGTMFAFYIRTKRVERRQDSVIDWQENNEHDIEVQLRVLLVEDNLINQQVLKKQLKKAGCVVDVANQGQEALEVLERKPDFDVVLMDMEMPIMDGLTATREIRKRQKEGKIVEHLPIIAVTANARQEQIDTAVGAGVDRVMQKPFKAVDLIHMMKDVVPQVSTPGSERPTPGLSGPMHGILI